MIAMRKRIVPHTIDGCVYKTLRDVQRHETLKQNPSIKSFHLPDAKEKSTYSRYGAHKCVTDDKDEKLVVDVKGKKTPEFRIKEKLFFHRYPELEFICVQWDSFEKEWRNLDDIEKDKRARKREKKKKIS